MIQVRGLTYSYPDSRCALDALTFDISEDEHVGLIGANGAGKTTLFLSLCGVLGVKPGMVSVAGLDPSKAGDRKLLPSQVGIVFQNSDDQLFSATVFDDVAFGPLNMGLNSDEVQQRVAEALKQTGMTGQEDRVPFHLSGGSKRRAAIAGVLAMRPRVLLLDEPSMYLDPRGRRELIGLIRELPGTKLIGSHDLELIIDTCSRVLLLDQGKLIADGPTESILRNAELMEPHGLEVPMRWRAI